MNDKFLYGLIITLSGNTYVQTVKLLLLKSFYGRSMYFFLLCIVANEASLHSGVG